MKILHLSDFHLNSSNLNDWDMYIKDALVNLVHENVNKGEDLFILCTGDLIDKGGKEYCGVEKALNLFKEKVIDVLVAETGISLDHFIITPGNHDIDRSADDEIANSGLRSSFSSESDGIMKLNNYAQSIISSEKDKRYSKRMIPFKSFEKNLYKDFPNVSCSFLGTSFVFECDNKTMCFNAINTSWLAYDDYDSEYGVAISEAQYDFFKEVLRQSDVKIALMHHPMDWLKYENNTIGKWLFADYDIMTVGHIHEADSQITTKLSGTMFINVAPCFTNNIREDRKSFANGLTLIDYNPKSRQICCKYYVFNLAQRKYIPSVDYLENGIFETTIPSHSDNTIEGIVEHALDYIKTEQYPNINEDIIPQKANAISGLRDAYVHMPITQQGDDERKFIDFNSILNNTQNQLFFGASDSGKTVLLYRLVMEFTDDYHLHNLIPIYLNFNEQGNRDISTIIKDYIDCNSSELQELLKAKRIILLVDNYTVIEEYKFQRQKLYQFIKDYDVRIIATATNSISGVMPPLFLDNNKIAFEFFFIEQFKTENIKQLMNKWSPDDEYLSRNSKIEKLVSNFCSYSLPCTAMSVSLYLWSTENANREPVNQAVLLDIYIEIILEKLSKENVYHNTFDYKNKTMLLAYLAKFLHDNNTYSFSYGTYIDIIAQYLNNVGFKTFDSVKLGDYFIARKIFIRKGNEISFAHTCFYHFFLARRLEDDKAFYSYVVHPERFYKYERVIDYYSGLVRKDEYLLDVLYKEFNNYFLQAQPIYEEIDIDDFFTNVTTKRKSFIPIAQNMDMKKAVANKPDQETVDKHIQEVSDERLSKISDEINSITYLTPDQFIVIMSRLLRNLDGIENVELKTEIYSTIIRNTLIFAISLKNRLAIYANTHDGQLPPGFERIKNTEVLLRFIPYVFEHALYEFMGTTKLCQVFENKLERDFQYDTSDVEKYLTLGILWDTNNLANTKMMKKFIRTVRKNSARDYVTLKLYYNYMYKVKSDSKEEEEYLALLSSLKASQYLLPVIKHKLINKELKQEKRKRNNK